MRTPNLKFSVSRKRNILNYQKRLGLFLHKSILTHEKIALSFHFTKQKSSLENKGEKNHLKLDTAFLTHSITFYSILKIKPLRNESEHSQSYFSLSINLSNKKDGLLKSIRPSYPAIYFLRGPLVAPPHASIMTKTPEESKLKIETLAEAQKKMQELLSDPKLNLPKHFPERSPEGIVLLDKNNKLHQELE
ncbi:hypothetical protein ACSQ7W_00015 [Bacillus halotolerans]|uniref:hypothetical protein n=1 Tax=Bacillus halotolerans TaxID=260554 RepID=UPI00192B918B|nr:hypothetical protein [Bacillus halotolerans]MBL4966679.1 hypothetical protein [Bacillus halotolerans]HEB7570490.1 hypothetical protein [Campylobacter coli]